MPAPDAIAKLIERYDRHADSYRQPSYNETALRREFIDPFFKALGWDVDNESGYAEAYKDVIHEYSLRMGESTNAPDYCFRIGGAPKFFVETLEVISLKKILTADLNPSANYCLDESGEACFPGGAAGGYGIVVPDQIRLYVLGLLNSRCVDFILQRTSTVFRGGWFAYVAKNLGRLPILLPSSEPEERIASAISNMVERAIDLQHRMRQAKTTHERTALQRQIEGTDREIDLLVYELYGLTDEEIRIVEEATA